MTIQDKTIIDGNSIGFLSQQSGASLKAGSQDTQAVFGFVQQMRDIAQKRRGTGLIVLWDGRSWRKAENSEYKSTRTATKKSRDMRDSYKSQVPFIKRALTTLGVSQAIASNLEADDLAAMLTERYVKQGNKVRLFTRDHDWMQMVQEGVVWVDHKTHTRVSHKNFQEETGYEDRFQFSEAKALKGDVSDNIKPVCPGFGEAKVKLLMEVWGSVNDFLTDTNPLETWKSHKTGKFPKAMMDFHEAGADRYFENVRMMDLTIPENLPPAKDLKVTKGKFDPEGFRAICRELAFHSYLNDFDNFIHPFLPIKED